MPTAPGATDRNNTPAAPRTPGTVLTALADEEHTWNTTLDRADTSTKTQGNLAQPLPLLPAMPYNTGNRDRRNGEERLSMTQQYEDRAENPRRSGRNNQ